MLLSIGYDEITAPQFGRPIHLSISHSSHPLNIMGYHRFRRPPPFVARCSSLVTRFPDPRLRDPKLRNRSSSLAVVPNSRHPLCILTYLPYLPYLTGAFSVFWAQACPVKKLDSGIPRFRDTRYELASYLLPARRSSLVGRTKFHTKIFIRKQRPAPKKHHRGTEDQPRSHRVPYLRGGMHLGMPCK